jgi:hypothetical protein
MSNANGGTRQLYFTSTAPTSPDPNRPAWQKAILALPEEDRTAFQDILASSLNSFDKLTLAAASPAPDSSLSTTARDDVLKDLFNLIEIVALNGSTSVFKYFAKSSKEVERIDDYLYAVCSQILAEEVPLGPPSPEYLVPQIIAVIAIGSRLTYPNAIPSPLSLLRFNSTRIMHKVKYVHPQIHQPCILAACDGFLHTIIPQGFSNFTTEILIRCTVEGLLLSILLQESVNFNLFDSVENLLDCVKDRVETLFDHATSPRQILMNIAPIDFQIKTLSQVYRKLRVSPQQSEGWRKVCDLYLKALKKIIRCGKEDEDLDLYSVAVVQRMLLHALLTGVARNVSYKDIQRITRDMESSSAAVAAWAPPIWLRELEIDTKIVKEAVLPFLLKLNPSPNHLIDTLSTPGFLDLYTPSVVASRLEALPKIDRACAFCGAEGRSLRLCGGVSSKLFFFSFRSLTFTLIYYIFFF